MMSDYVLQTRNLTKVYADKTALADFNLQIARGGVHALIGSNGAGKSTLFKLILGFLTPNGGSSKVLDTPSEALTPAVRGRIGYVNEEHTLPDWLKVRELKAIQQSYYPHWREDIYRSVITNFDVGSEQKISNLSRGERAGFNLAMALAQNPELLILDEPTLGLDVVATQEFLNSVLYCSQDSTTVIYCSHQMDEVERLADELIVMERGHLRVQSSPEDFSSRVKRWVIAAQYRELLLARVPDVLSSRVVEDQLYFHVIDKSEAFVSELALLGIRDCASCEIGMSDAVRAYLSKNHLGTSE
jgi:ABC-2 type transport system ATP-binding protein